MDWFEELKIEFIEITTADKTNGMAGKDINWIKVNPKSFNGSDNDGKNLPIKIEIGNIINKKNLGCLNVIRNDLRDA